MLARRAYIPSRYRVFQVRDDRQRIAEALFNAIRKYQTSLKNATTIALQ